jgi:hypothetical protein
MIESGQRMWAAIERGDARAAGREYVNTLTAAVGTVGLSNRIARGRSGPRQPGPTAPDRPRANAPARPTPVRNEPPTRSRTPTGESEAQTVSPPPGVQNPAPPPVEGSTNIARHPQGGYPMPPGEFLRPCVPNVLASHARRSGYPGAVVGDRPMRRGSVDRYAARLGGYRVGNMAALRRFARRLAAGTRIWVDAFRSEPTGGQARHALLAEVGPRGALTFTDATGFTMIDRNFIRTTAPGIVIETELPRGVLVVPHPANLERFTIRRWVVLPPIQ